MKQNIAQIFLEAKTYIYIYNIQQCSQKICCKEGNYIFMIKYFIKINYNQKKFLFRSDSEDIENIKSA